LRKTDDGMEAKVPIRIVDHVPEDESAH
jgi:hypothetical protein